MKKLLFVFRILIIGLTSSLLNAQTNVSGMISNNTTWTLANSPYIVTGSVLVMNGVTLTIEQGVTVKFDSAKAIQIDGTLIARGTSNNKVTFTSNQVSPAAGDWGYILFSDSSTDATYDGSENYTGGSILEYCIIEYAGGVSISDNGAVWMNNAHPFINYCTIRNNRTSGIYALDLSKNLKISNNTIINNLALSSSGGGIYVYGGIVTISNNIISSNTSSSFGGGIYVQGGAECTVFILNNTISDNASSRDGGGIYSYSYSYCDIPSMIIISKNTISNNTTSYNGGGIYSYYSSPAFSSCPAGGCPSCILTISNNTINNNTALDGGGGIFSEHGYYLEGYPSPNITISNNTIIRNSANNFSAVRFDGVEDSKYNSITDNLANGPTPTCTIYIRDNPLFNYNNIFSNVATYELWNDNAQGSTYIDGINNFWGTAISSDIQAKIYDWVDDATKGIVDFLPFLTSPDTTAPVLRPSNVQKSVVGGSVHLTWNANLENDIAGYRIHYGSSTRYSYVNNIDVGNVTSYPLSGVSISDTIAVTAYDISRVVSNDQCEGHESWYAYAFDTAATTGASVHDNEIPKIYTLQQNYPNPFNPRTNISFTLPYQSHVSLKVYDILGKEVATLVNEVKAAGSYTATLNGAKLTSGIYFYRLTAGSFFETKKLLLLK